MTLYYCASTSGFYDSHIHGDAIPADRVEITLGRYAELLNEQAAGYTIQSDVNGLPVTVAPVAPTLDEKKAALCAKIDAASDEAYIAIGGPSPGRLSEYEWAKAEAAAFKAAGYLGDVPESLAIWVAASGMSPEAACDNILATAAAWESARAAVRRRLISKAKVNAAADAAAAQAAADAALAELDSIVASAKA